MLILQPPLPWPVVRSPLTARAQPQQGSQDSSGAAEHKESHPGPIAQPSSGYSCSTATDSLSFPPQPANPWARACLLRSALALQNILFLPTLEHRCIIYHELKQCKGSVIPVPRVFRNSKDEFSLSKGVIQKAGQ